MPGRKLLLQSTWAAVSAASSTLLEPLTTSTRYLNLNFRPSWLMAHQLGLSWYATSVALYVASSMGPVPTGLVLAPVICCVAESLDQMCCGTTGAFHR